MQKDRTEAYENEPIFHSNLEHILAKLFGTVSLLTKHAVMPCPYGRGSRGWAGGLRILPLWV